MAALRPVDEDAETLMNTNLYDSDFYAWTQRQSELLRAGKLEDVDLEHLADEIEDMGRSEKSTLESRLEVLLMHLLKWQFQPAYRGKSWKLTIKEQRIRLLEHLTENPSLKSHLTTGSDKAYRLAVLGAEKETGREDFPETCPYTLEQIFDEAFFPE